MKVSCRCNRLHTAVNKAKSLIANSAQMNKDLLLRNLTIFDPMNVVLPEERIKFGLSLGPSISYMS